MALMYILIGLIIFWWTSKKPLPKIQWKRMKKITIYL
jgi:hypothetical protein